MATPPVKLAPIVGLQRQDVKEIGSEMKLSAKSTTPLKNLSRTIERRPVVEVLVQHRVRVQRVEDVHLQPNVAP
jgi:hypothetical protein